MRNMNQKIPLSPSILLLLPVSSTSASSSTSANSSLSANSSTATTVKEVVESTAAPTVQRTVIRTKAEAKEFAPPTTDRTSSSSNSSDPTSRSTKVGPSNSSGNVHHSSSSLGSIQRKLSEPSKMPPSSTALNVKSRGDPIWWK